MLDRECTKIDLNVDTKEDSQTFPLSAANEVRPEQLPSLLENQSVSQVGSGATETTEGRANKADPLEQIFAKTKKPPSLVFLFVSVASALLIGIPSLHSSELGLVLRSLAGLLVFATATYLLNSNLRMHAACLLEDDHEYLSPINLLIANLCLISFAATTLTFENSSWSVLFVSFTIAATALSSAVQTVYLMRFVKAFAPKLSAKAQLLIQISPLLGNLTAIWLYPPLLLFSQFAILGGQTFLLRMVKKKSAQVGVAAGAPHSSQILLPYQSSDTERMFTSRMVALKKRPSLVAVAFACCVSLIALVNWFFNKYISQTPLITQTKMTAVLPATSLAPPAYLAPDGFQIVILGAIALVFYLAIRALLSRPSFICFGSNGIRLIYTRLWTHQGELLRWDDLKKIRLENSRTSSTDPSIIFAASQGLNIKLKLNCIGNAVDRKLMLSAIRQWGKMVPRDPGVEEILEIPSDHSYTELWLQSLAAPPKRERLKPLIAGAVLQEGAFEVVRPLGSGGQGFAYLVWDTINNEVVVLKEFILPTFVSSTVRMRALEAFEHEARILKSLNNEQIVRLRDYFIEDHRAYLVLDYLKGVTLKDLIRESGPLDETTTLHLARKMCDILVYLHGLAPPVIHRDFTPDNLIYDLDGKLTLIDFNVAQEDQQATTGNIVGKHAYVPPEQFQGQARTASDIYAFGATLFYLLTGVDPQPITTSILSESLPSISPDLDRLVRTATALDPQERQQTADDLLKDICELIGNRKLDSNSTYTPHLEAARPTDTKNPDTDPISQEQSSVELQVEPRESIKMNIVKRDTKTKQGSVYLPLASCAIVVLSLFSLAWLAMRPFQEFLAPELKKVHANADFGEKLSTVYEAWYRLRLKLADERANQLIAEFSSNPYISKAYLSRLYEEKAFILLRKKEPRQAIEFASKALALGPSISAFNIRARAYFSLNELTKAQSDCNEAIHQKVDYVRPKGMPDFPLDHFDTIAFSTLQRANCELLLGNPKLCLKDLAAVSEKVPLGSESILTRGLAKEFEEDFLGATKDLTTYDELEKQFGTARCRFAESELGRLSNYRAAKEISLQQGIPFKQDEFWQVRKAVIQKDYAKVITLTTKYLEKHPENPEYLIDQANAFAALKETTKESQILAYVNQISPQNQEAQWGLAELYHEQGDDQKSLGLFKTLSERAPRAEYFLRMAVILTKQRHYPEALTCYEKALQLAPSWKIARSGHGGVLVLLGRFKEAADEIHGIEFNDSEEQEYVQGLYRLAKARRALNQFSAEEWNLQAIKDIGLTPSED
jgi:serine/threonine protein kinase/Tfp pilus assembly protein PilF